ncbi:hypothetical protein FOZ63_023782, partial [Perkinsus olseni]
YYDNMELTKSYHVLRFGSGSTRQWLELLATMTDSSSERKGAVGPGLKDLLDSLETVEGLVTFDEQLEGVVSEINKDSFKLIMEALAKWVTGRWTPEPSAGVRS